MATMSFEEDADLMAMRIAEFEAEAENVLEILTALRADARETDASFVQDTAAELGRGSGTSGSSSQSIAAPVAGQAGCRTLADIRADCRSRAFLTTAPV
jgi:hypothetical protein